MLISKKYLVVPINPEADSKKVFMFYGGDLIFDFDARLDFVNPSCLQYLNVERFKGLDIEFSCKPETELNFSFTNKKSSHIRDKINRPMAHFTAEHGWINDPNGLVQLNGEYHLFFQHNPAGTDWGNMTWGHAVSRDLIHWRELGDAIFPDRNGTIFSGGAIVDRDNVSGLSPDGKPVLLAYYTAAGNTSELSKNKPFAQHLVYSDDGGNTLKKYEQNPIIPHIAGENRDPVVTYVDELKQFVLSLYLDGHDFAFFSSSDLVHWAEFQRLTAPDDAECPNLISLPVDLSCERKWLFFGASDTYTVGYFSNGTFIPEQDFMRYYRYEPMGKTSYASQAFTDENGRAIRIAWENMRSHGASFQGQLGIPCEMSLAKIGERYYLRTAPVKEFEDNCTAVYQAIDYAVSGDNPLNIPLARGAYDITLEASVGSADFNFSVFGINFTVRASQNILEFCTIQIPMRISESEKIQIRIIADTLGVEVFTDNGLIYSTAEIMPDFSAAGLTLAPLNGSDITCNLKISLFNN